MKPLCVVAVLSLLLTCLVACLEAAGYEVAPMAPLVAILLGLPSVVWIGFLAHQVNEHNHAEAMLTLKTELDLASRGEES
jgi:hypothetical protein